MLKWLLALAIVLVIVAVATPSAAASRRRFALGRLPGDLRIPLRGRLYYVPFTSTVLLSFLVWLVAKVL